MQYGVAKSPDTLVASHSLPLTSLGCSSGMPPLRQVGISLSLYLLGTQVKYLPYK